VYGTMTRKLTITVSDEVYKGLREKIGPGKISRFQIDKHSGKPKGIIGLDLSFGS
jgi:hypothetical protein